MSERTWLVLSGRLMHTIRKESLVYVFVHITICNLTHAHGNPIAHRSHTKTQWIWIYIYIYANNLWMTISIPRIYIKKSQNMSQPVVLNCMMVPKRTHKCVYTLTFPAVPQHECNVLLIGNAVDMLPNWIEWSQGTKYLTPDFTSPP